MLRFPHEAPGFGAPPTAIGDGLYWLRLPLPFALDHVNIWLFEETDGWLAIDAGINTPESRAAWEDVFRFIGGPRRLKRLIVTHHHMDHVGLAAWLQKQTGCAVLMSAPEVEELAKNLAPEPPDRDRRLVEHYLSIGCSEQELVPLARSRPDIQKLVSGMPAAIQTVSAGDTIRIGGHDWTCSFGGGHATASIILTRQDGTLVIVGDQILTPISPFIGTFMDNRDANPLQDYIDFLEDIGPKVPDHALLLPGHRLPFFGGRSRAMDLVDHHDVRCDRILAACANHARTVRELVGAVFERNLDGVMALALAETQAHANYLVEQGRLVRFADHGIIKVRMPV